MKCFEKGMRLEMIRWSRFTKKEMNQNKYLMSTSLKTTLKKAIEKKQFAQVRLHYYSLFP